MALTLAKVEEMAPDQASLGAARKLLNTQSWPTVATDGTDIVWGECQGSGSVPYRVVLSEADFGYKCTCPSRKFPCKHTLALMWMRAEGRSFSKQDRPAWVADWLSRRRGPSASRAPAREPENAGAKVSIAAEPEAEPAVVDPKAQARAEAQRERNRQERETSILAGLEQLDRWILDQLERGLAGFQ